LVDALRGIGRPGKGGTKAGNLTETVAGKNTAMKKGPGTKLPGATRVINLFVTHGGGERGKGLGTTHDSFGTEKERRRKKVWSKIKKQWHCSTVRIRRKWTFADSNIDPRKREGANKL